MYTIAFDETTDFEELRSRNRDKREEPAMLAGVIFNDTSRSVYKKDGRITEPERERIVLYYKKVCKAVHTSFPRDLHVTSNKSNADNVSKTKNEIRQTLGEFIKKGTYRGKELLFSDENNNIVVNGGTALKREGSYQIVAVLKTSEMPVRSEENVILRDDVASNLYLNMVQEYLVKGVFCNLSIKESVPTVAFNLATRTLKKNDVSNINNYYKTGFGSSYKAGKEGEKGEDVFEIIDSGYGHALITELSKIRPVNIEELFTKSISYYQKQAVKQAFLYLSDSICSVLSFEIGKPYDKNIRKRMNQLNDPKRNLFFYYEGLNDYYDRAAKAYLRKDMLAALGEIFDGRHWSAAEVKKYYRKKWYAILEKNILEAMDSGTLKKTIDELNQYRYTDNLEQDKLLYMLDIVEKAGNNTYVESRYRFKLADIGISAYTHTGNPKKAEQYYNKCMKYQDDVDSDELQRVQIRYITTLNDLFAFERARDHALGLLGIDLNKQPSEPEKKKNFIKRVIEWLLVKGSNKTNDSIETDSDNIISLLPEKVSRPNMYKTLSSLGQTYAFLKDPQAEYCFIKSINDIKYAPDSSMTKSFLLHWYIDNGDEEKYRKNAVDYFNGRSDLNEQLVYLIKEGSKKREESPRFFLGYAMYVYIKAFYTFYKDDRNNAAVARKLIRIKDTVNSIVPNGERFMKGHPWEIIYKYAALLAAHKTKKSYIAMRTENKRCAKNAVGNHPECIIRRVTEFGDIELLSQELGSDDKKRRYSRKINRLWNELYNEGLFSDRNPAETSDTEKLDDLRGKFTFMYH